MTMRITTAAVCLVGLLGLAACDRHEVNEVNASVEDVANAVAQSDAAITLKPGRWETTGKLIELSAPNLPPHAQEMMKRQMAASASKVAVCLKPEDVAKPNAGFFGQASKDCRFDHYRMSGGKLDAQMSCTPKGGPGKTTTTMTGTYASDRYDMELSSATVAGENQPMTMRMHMVSTRTGNCTGDEVSATPAA